MDNPFLDLSRKLAELDEKMNAVLAAVQQRPNTEKFLTVQEAAKRLKVAPITVYRQIECGKIPAKRIGSRVLIPSTFFEQ